MTIDVSNINPNFTAGVNTNSIALLQQTLEEIKAQLENAQADIVAVGTGVPIYQSTFTEADPNLLTISESVTGSMTSGLIGVRLPDTDLNSNSNPVNFVTGAGDQGAINLYVGLSNIDVSQVFGGDLWLLQYNARQDSGWYWINPRGIIF